MTRVVHGGRLQPRDVAFDIQHAKFRAIQADFEIEMIVR